MFLLLCWHRDTSLSNLINASAITEKNWTLTVRKHAALLGEACFRPSEESRVWPRNTFIRIWKDSWAVPSCFPGVPEWKAFKLLLKWRELSFCVCSLSVTHFVNLLAFRQTGWWSCALTYHLSCRQSPGSQCLGSSHKPASYQSSSSSLWLQ